MKITFLGTGTSQGVPIIACECEVCTSSDSKDKRLRCSILIELDNYNIIIDTGPDFRYQMLRANVQRLDAILYTHSHKDHIAGMDDIRAFNHKQQSAIDIYATPFTIQSLQREFDYVFSDFKYPGIPEVNIHHIENQPFEVANSLIIPIRTLHYKMEVFGFRIGDFTYITDANYIAPEELEKVKGSKYLVLNALRHEPHISHFTLEQAIEIAEYIGAESTYFTHISHQLGLHDEINAALPKGMQLAYDGLFFDCK